MTHALSRTLAAALALVASVASVGSAQQSGTITGKVAAEGGQPVEGANVLIPDLQISVGTNAAGVYTITIPAARLNGTTVILRTRAIGYTPETRQVVLRAGVQTFNFDLKKDVSRLQQVVVTGVTGATEQTKVPFSVSRLDASDMPVPAINPLTQLQGKVPGANIVSFSGRPGAQPAVLLRGPTSINAAGRGQDPLYIVDGVILNGPLPDINPQDIESVEVVKGAAAASLYGSRAGNGVIQITTKNGRAGTQNNIKFGVRAEYGTGDIERSISIAQRHGLLLAAGGENRFCQSGVTYAGSLAGYDCYRTFNYQTEALRINQLGGDFALAAPGFPIDPGANIQGAQARHRFQSQLWTNETFNAVNQVAQPQPAGIYNIDATGRFGRTTFFASANVTDQRGSIRGLTGLQRNGYRLNLDHRVNDKLTLSANTYYARSETDGLNQEDNGGAFFRLTRVPPIVNLLRTDSLGRLFIRPNLQNGGSQNENPLYPLQNIDRTDISDRMLAGTSLRYAPTAWADLEWNFAFDLTRQNGRQNQDKGFRTTTGPSAVNLGSVFYYGQTSQSVNTSLNATARQTLGKLNLRYNTRYLYEQQNFDGFNGSGSQLAVQGVNTIGNSLATTRSGGSSATFVRQISGFAGVNLDYDDKYIVDLLIRRDGTSLFGSANRWATLGRGSVAYRLSQEKFWGVPGITDLKLRASRGTAANRPIFSAQYETFGVNAAGIAVPGVLGNVNLRPEIVTETEMGFDALLFNKFTVIVTRAQSRATDQILQVPLVAAAGFSSQWQNAGTLEGNTWEASVRAPIIQTRDIDWSFQVNYDRVRSMVTELRVPAYNFGNDNVTNAGGVFRIEAGVPYGELFGRRFVQSCAQLPANFASQCGTPTSQFQRNSDGYIVWTGGYGLNEGVTRNLWSASLPAAQGPWGVQATWGHPLVLRDSTGAGLQRSIGNVLPDYRWSISQNFRYKRLTANVLLDATVGRSVVNQGLHWSLLDFLWGGSDQINQTVGSARPMSYYYRASLPDNGAGLGGLYDVLGPNNFNTERSTFARVREIVFNYRVGKLSSVGGDWNVGVIGRNLFTFTNYRGFDPEVGVAGGQAGSGVLNAFDNFTFPNIRTVTLSIGTTF